MHDSSLHMELANLDISWVLISAALVLLMQVGFCLLESGLVRAKNSINVAIKNMSDLCISSVFYWLFGFGIMFGFSWNGWLGTEFFMIDSRDNPSLVSFFVFQLVFCGTATTIISGAVAERMRFSAYLLIAAISSGIIYPFFGHWAWGGAIPESGQGWLASKGFVDFAGSTVVHSVGGWVALAAILVIGPRLGAFSNQAKPIQGHNLTLASAGVILLWVGWIGFNGGSTLALNEQVPHIIANTVISGAFGGTASMLTAYAYYRKARTWAIMNGIIGGLVGITACCHVVSTSGAAIVGITSGILCFFGMRAMERYKIDDAVGAVPAHAFCGAWGTLCVAFFGLPELWDTGLGRFEQLTVQATGLMTCLAWSFGLAYILLKSINRYMPLRVTEEEERAGLNVSEHGASTELIDLITEMGEQERAGSFSKRVHVEPHTEVGQIAAEYNRVLNRVENEFYKRERALTAVQKAQIEAYRANEVKSEFLANMSHELRTPLGIIIGYIELIKDDLREAGVNFSDEDFDTIIHASKHLLNLINGVLDISKIEAGHTQISINYVNVPALVEDLERSVLPLVMENNNTFKAEIADDLDIIYTDHIKLEQCLLNLISNAAKFTSDGTITLHTYKEKTEDGEEDIYFDVTDTGIGMSAKDTAKIFEAFTQVDSTQTRKYEGTGLGLAITKNFAELLGGDVTVASEIGKGSTFSLYLPCKKSAESEGPFTESAVKNKT